MTEDCAATCDNSGFFGRSGECLDNFTCVCPEGFSGVDDWTTSNDCHVNEKLAFGMHLFHNIFGFLGFLSNSICILMLGRRWGFYFPFFADRLAPSDLLNPDKTRKIKKQTLAVCYLDWLFNVALIPYQLPFLLKIDGRRRNLEDGYPWQHISIGVATSAILAACYVFLLAWFLSLPDTKLKTILGLPTFLEHNPRIMHNLSFYMVAVAFIGGQIILVILPGITGSPQKLDPSLISLYIIFVVLYCLVFEVIQCVFIGMFVKTFKSALLRIESNTSSSFKLLNKHAILLKRIIYIANLFSNALSGVVVGAISALIAWLSFQGRDEYFFLSLLRAFPNVGSFLIPLIILRRTNGGLIPLVIKDVSPPNSETEML